MGARIRSYVTAQKSRTEHEKCGKGKRLLQRCSLLYYHEYPRGDILQVVYLETGGEFHTRIGLYNLGESP